MTWTNKLKKMIGLYTDPGWFAAAKAGDVGAIEAFLTSGIRVNARDEWDDTALTWAALNGRTEACRVLVKAGADLDASQYEGATALILAADRGHLEIVRVLVEAGADLNLHHGKEDKPVLAFAARGGHREVVDYLQARGAGWR
jgi:hypothetical protein